MIPQIIPQPVRVETRTGTFTLSPGAAIAARDEAVETALLLSQWLGKPTGYPLPVQPLLAPGQAGIRLELDLSLAHLGREGYPWKPAPRAPCCAPRRPPDCSTPPRACASSSRPKSSRRAASPAAPRPGRPRPSSSKIPRASAGAAACSIAAAISCRLSSSSAIIDLLALHKLNVFHWHLTDDQGWRIEIQQYPRLTEVGAWRSETLVGRMTRERTDLQIRRRARTAVFIPRPRSGAWWNMPAGATCACCPRSRCPAMPRPRSPPTPSWAAAARRKSPATGASSPTMFSTPSNPTFEFLENVFDEVADLFPGEFIHVGGDEVLKQAWKENPAVQARMKALGLADEHELQSYFIRRMEAVLQARGRRLVGWDEILEGGLAPNATVMSWRGEAGGIAAAQAGHDVVMAPNTYTYFDYYQSADKAAEPLAIGGWVPLSKVYAYNPIPAELTPEQAGHVLGTQFQIWCEYLSGPAEVEYMAFPRACALAEAAWSPQAARDWDNFTTRLSAHLKRLDGLKVNYRKAEWE